MLDSPSESFTPSPSLILSQMSDPSGLLSTLCAPFLKTADDIINPDAFGLSLVRSLLPNIMKTLQNKDQSAINTLPTLVKLSIDNLGQEGLDLFTNEVLPEIFNMYIKDPSYLDLYCQAVASISTKYRDDVLVDLIGHFSTSEDYRHRVLAASIIYLVRRHNRVLAQFRSLASDPNEKVRIAIVCSLPNCNFSEIVIDGVVTAAAHDISPKVKKAVAKEVGYVSPQLTDLYIKLLNDFDTQESCLTCFAAMVKYSGFSIFFESFLKIIENYPDQAALTLLQVAPLVDPSEHRLLYQSSKKLRHNKTFIINFYHFTRSFTNREPFLKFFKISRMPDWKERLLYCEQSQYFVEDFGILLLHLALGFATDECKAVRFQSINVLTELVRKVPETVPSILSLANSSSAQKIILANISINIIENRSVRSKPEETLVDSDIQKDLENETQIESVDINYQNELKKEFEEIKKKLEKDRDPRVRSQFKSKQHNENK